MFSNCEGQSKLPKDLPSNAEIIYISDGGLLPSLFRVEIRGTTMKITENSEKTERKDFVREVKLSDNELKNLYQTFVENKFDSIKPNKNPEVADGKMRSIELKFDGKLFFGINGDGINPPKGHGERFGKIEDAISKLVAAHTQNAETRTK